MSLPVQSEQSEQDLGRKRLVRSVRARARFGDPFSVEEKTFIAGQNSILLRVFSVLQT